MVLLPVSGRPVFSHCGIPTNIVKVCGTLCIVFEDCELGQPVVLGIHFLFCRCMQNCLEHYVRLLSVTLAHAMVAITQLLPNSFQHVDLVQQEQ